MSEARKSKPKRLTPTQKIEALKTEFYTHAKYAQVQFENLHTSRTDLENSFLDLKLNLDGMKIRNYVALALAGLALLVALVF